MCTEFLRRRPDFPVMFVLLMSVAVDGCATKGRTGAAVGGGLGAIIGQAVGRDTEATLIGAAVGGGVGYIIGNEADKKEAEKLSTADYSQQAGSPLSGTSWKVISLVTDKPNPYRSIVVEFRQDGRVITTKTSPSGSVTRHDERYRVVGTTLIVNKPGYLINAKYRIDGNDLIIDAERIRAVLRRL
ncbi:MAG: glycine zipper 2TM domain-containing protein [Phycisphaerales bacterium]|nr:MAG: glycine zipper 2TM domain-containing protein [Phycisphaerales bacterium]